jgi:hypothetical protein
VGGGLIEEKEIGGRKEKFDQGEPAFFSPT